NIVHGWPPSLGALSARPLNPSNSGVVYGTTRSSGWPAASSHLVDRWAETTRAGEEEDEADRRRRAAIASLARALLRLTIIVTSVWALLVFTSTSLEDLPALLRTPLPFQDAEGTTWWDLLSAIVLLVLFLFLAKHLKAALREIILPRTGLDQGVQYTITTITGYVLVGIGIYLALAAVFDLKSFGYIVAALSVGIGFGLQEIVSNFISGLILLFERPLKVGDMVQIGETTGVVKHISIRATTIRTFDNVFIVVPNRDLITQNVTNFVLDDPKVRARLQIGVAYGSDLALVRRTLLEVASSHGLVLRKPAPDVWLDGFGESSIDFTLLVWVADPFTRIRACTDLRFAIDAAFRRSGIEMPFPQRDLHLRSSEPIRIIHENSSPRETVPGGTAMTPRATPATDASTSGAGGRDGQV
ncbi:MAG: mechanosensitive ion channel domain-containing protein, partial [Planctomycetota bacterium]